MKQPSVQTILKPLVDWYLNNKRDLPWRKSGQPYHIYISEVVFQQTRIEQGLGYYSSIIEKYPNIQALAAAHEDDFLKLWQGLGYYSRAHNLLKAAKIIVSEHNGLIPETPELLKKLPGIGPYTAAAIASIAFSVPVPVVDGNVKRLIGRLLCIDVPTDHPEITSIIEGWLLKGINSFHPGDFNQALMEAGALLCLPRNPRCNDCPLQKNCCAYAKDKTAIYPLKTAQKEKPTLFLHYFIIHPKKNDSGFFLLKRNMNGIWKGLYEFPLAESHSKVMPETLFAELGTKPTSIKMVFEAQHVLTHKKLHAMFYEVTLKATFPENWLYVTPQNADEFPVHHLMEQFLLFRKGN